MSAEAALRQRTVALVGLMGAGKSSVGRRLALALGIPFRDADEEVARAAGRSVADIFSELGEAAFRDGERRVIARLLDEPPQVLATGGGAFMHPDTRRLIAEKAISVWLKADLDVLAKRVARKTDRPLLQGRDAREVLEELALERDPIYALADITVDSMESPHHTTVQTIIDALRARLAAGVAPQ
jgi:shikimate kinase